MKQSSWAKLAKLVAHNKVRFKASATVLAIGLMAASHVSANAGTTASESSRVEPTTSSPSIASQMMPRQQQADLAPNESHPFTAPNDAVSLGELETEASEEATFFQVTHPDGQSEVLSVRCMTADGASVDGCFAAVQDKNIMVHNETEERVQAIVSSSRDLEELADNQSSVIGKMHATKAINSYIGVPSNYIYDPSWQRWGVYKIQHDYCSFSPDSMLGADLRGPCAYHDLCYERYNNVGGRFISNPAKALIRNSVCQAPLGAMVQRNCAHANPRNWVRRQACYSYGAGMVATVRSAAGSQP